MGSRFKILMILFIHIFSAILGISTATIRSILFLKKGSLNQPLQKLVWFLLILLGSTGVLLALAKPTLLHDPKFLMKMFLVGALFATEAYSVIRRSKSAIFTSLFSWYFSFFWSGLERLEFGYLGILGTYSGTILLIFILSKLRIPSPNI